MDGYNQPFSFQVNFFSLFIFLISTRINNKVDYNLTASATDGHRIEGGGGVRHIPDGNQPPGPGKFGLWDMWDGKSGKTIKGSSVNAENIDGLNFGMLNHLVIHSVLPSSHVAPGMRPRGMLWTRSAESESPGVVAMSPESALESIKMSRLRLRNVLFNL